MCLESDGTGTTPPWRGLDYVRLTPAISDARLADAVDLLHEQRQAERALAAPETHSRDAARRDGEARAGEPLEHPARTPRSATSRSFSGSMLIWAAIWTLAGIAGAMMLAIVALLTWWSYEAGVLWLFLLFLGLMATLFILSSRKKDEDVEDDDGEDLTDMESFEVELRR